MSVSNVSSNTYKNMQEWQAKHLKIDSKFIQMQNAGKTQDELANFYNSEVDKIGFSYDILEGKERNNENYTSQLARIGAGAILEYDTDGDRKISEAEYFTHEIKDFPLFDTEITKQEIFDSLLYFKAIDENFNSSNASGTLEPSEIASLYHFLDKVDESSDGNIKITTLDSKKQIIQDAAFKPAENWGEIEKEAWEQVDGLYEKYIVKDASYEKLLAWFEDPSATAPYDFMNGKNPNDWDDYDGQTQILGQSAIDYYDTNGDGKLSQEEYDMDIFGTPFEKLDYRLSSNDKEVQDGYLDASEMGAYWEYLDTYDADGRSGKISK